MRVFRGGFAAGDKVTYNGTELLCHGCVVAATSAPERPTYVSPVQSVATRPQGIPVSDQLHSPDSDFSTSGKQSVYQLWFHTVHVLLTVILIRTLAALFMSLPDRAPVLNVSFVRLLPLGAVV